MDEPVSRSDTSHTDPAPSGSDDDQPVVLFLGNSLSAGYGLQPEESFPSLIEAKIDSAGLGFDVVNAGVSGDTSAGGLSRIDWLLDQDIAVLVLELGANDGLRGLPPDVTRRNLQQIIDRTRERHPDVRILLAGMQIPPNMGADYAERFRAIFPDLAQENDIDLVPFLLEGVGGVASLNQADGIHPTAAGQRIMADTVWEHIAPILREIDRERAL